MLTKRTCEEYLASPPDGNVDGHAVGIGELKLAVLALRQKLEPDFAFGAAGFRGESRVSIDERTEIFLKRLHILHFETQVVHVSRFDACAFIVGDRPRRNNDRDSPVG